YLLAHVARRLDLSLVAGYTRHLLRLPMSFFEMRRSGEILSRVHDVEKIRTAISGTALTALVDATVVGLLLGILWAYDLRLALVVTGFVPVLILGITLQQPAAQRYSRTALEESARYSGHLVEDVGGVEAVKAYGAEEARCERGESYLVRL